MGLKWSPEQVKVADLDKTGKTEAEIVQATGYTRAFVNKVRRALKAGDKPATLPPADSSGNNPPAGTPLRTALEIAQTKLRKAPVPTQVLAEADILVVQPKVFTMHSVLVWQAQEVAQREWNWPEMEPGDFLDTFLYNAFKQRGILLGAYKVMEVKDNGGS